MKYRLKENGFTLMEILVVISIIAILMAVFAPNLIGARSQARDAKRKADLDSLQKAFELYKSDQFPISYPASTFMNSNCGKCFSQGGVAATCTGNVYIKKIPCDPQTGSVYTYTLDGTDPVLYTLTACLENTQDRSKDAVPLVICSALSKVSYTVSEP